MERDWKSSMDKQWSKKKCIDCRKDTRRVWLGRCYICYKKYLKERREKRYKNE